MQADGCGETDSSSQDEKGESEQDQDGFEGPTSVLSSGQSLQELPCLAAEGMEEGLGGWRGLTMGWPGVWAP